MRALACGAVLCLAILMAGCKVPDRAGIKSDIRQQWMSVNADVTKTTSTAEAVLKELQLIDVKSRVTTVDGEVTATKADGTRVTVNVWKNDGGCDVSVVIGTLGEPDLGTDILRKINDRLTPKS